MNQSSFDPGRPKSRPYDYDSATGQSKPAPNPEFEEIFRRAKQHQQQIRRQQNQALTGRQPTQSFDPLPFPSAPKRTKPVHLEAGQSQLERDTTAAVMQNVQRRYGGGSSSRPGIPPANAGRSARTAPRQAPPPRQTSSSRQASSRQAVPDQYQYAMEQYQARQQKDSGAPASGKAAKGARTAREEPPSPQGKSKQKKKKHRKLTCCLIPFLLLVALVIAGIFAFQHYFGDL